MPPKTVRVEDKSLYAMILALHQLWAHYRGNRDPEVLTLEASRAEAETEEMLTRNDGGIHDIIEAFTPSIEDLVALFKQYATHMPDATLNEIVEEYDVSLRGARRATRATVGKGQDVLLIRGAVGRASASMADLMLGPFRQEGRSNELRQTAQLNTQMFLRRATFWQNTNDLDPELLERWNARFGRVYLLKMFAVFAANEALPETQRVPLQMLVLCGSYKYGLHADIVEAFGEMFKIYACLYCGFGPCQCANRPPAAGVAAMKQRQLKYPLSFADQVTAAREMTVDQLDAFMRVVYMTRNTSQDLTRGPDRTRWEWASEFVTGWRIAKAGSIGVVARAEGQFATVNRRRWAKAFEYAWPGGKDDPMRPSTDEEIQRLLHTPGGPYDRKLSDEAVRQIFRHAAADPMVWGPLPPITYGLSFWGTTVAAMREFVRMNNMVEHDIKLELNFPNN